ncbi:hypothetical protein GCM10027270_10690 [Nocardioides ginkgobilobae]
MSSRGWGGAGQAAAYAATCARLCAGAHPAVLEAVRPLTGRRVLDVGAGDGRLARALRGAGAHVVAVDPDPDMAGFTAGLPDLPFEDGAFDVVVACFVLNHVDDPRASAAELARVTAPGGRVVATTWPSGATAQSRMWQRVLDTEGVVAAPGVRLPEHLDFPRTVDGLAGLLRGAGLETEAREVGWTHDGPLAELWEGAAAGIGGIGATVAGQPVEVRERLRAAYDVEVGALAEDDRLRFRTEAVLAVGTRPGRMPA